MSREPERFWRWRKLDGEHFVAAGFIAFCVFLVGIVLMVLGTVGVNMYVDTRCKLQPEERRCVVLDERSVW